MSIDEFKKTDSQIDCVKWMINSPATNLCVVGGSRAGKSFIIAYAMIVRACKCKCDQLVVRSTFSAAKASLWMATFPQVLSGAFPGLPVKLDRSNYIMNFPNGSTIRIAGLDDGPRIEKLLGLEYVSIWANETNQIPFNAISKVRTRLAQKSILKNKTFYDLNPTNTNSWVYQLFEQKVDPQDGTALIDADDYSSFKMNVQGNLHNVSSDYLSMLKKLPEAEQKRFLLGEYDHSNNGTAVYAFNREEHISEEAVKLPGTVLVGADFNFLYNASIIASQTATQLYVWADSVIEGDTFMKCDALKRLGATGASVIADGTGKSRRSNGISDHRIMMDAGFNLIYQTNPRVKDKIANLNRCFTLGIIKIHPNCRKLIRDLTQTVWNKKDELDQKTDPSLTHCVDSLAYLCFRLYPLMGAPKSIGTMAR